MLTEANAPDRRLSGALGAFDQACTPRISNHLFGHKETFRLLHRMVSQELTNHFGNSSRILEMQTMPNT